MSQDDRIAEIGGWFHARGLELVVHPVEHGGYFAPQQIRKKLGNARFTWGMTAIEAAEAAQADHAGSENTAALAEGFRQAVDAGGALLGGKKPEHAQRDLGLERDVSRRDDPW